MRFCIPVILLLLSVSPDSRAQGFAVLELFTSEGCSKCPAAEELLKSVVSEADKNNKNIVALAYHVDYWNRLGWKDPFSKFQYTRRQENYSRVLADKELFTPQLVVNGQKSVVGSKTEEVKIAVANALSKPPGNSVTITQDSLVNDTLFLSYTTGKSDVNTVLRIGLTESGLKSEVKKGENAGKNFIHDHVVRMFYSVDTPGKEGSVAIPLKSLKVNSGMTLVAFIQTKQSMKITAAVKYPVSVTGL